MEQSPTEHFFQRFYPKDSSPAYEKMLLRFMEQSIEKINYCLASTYASQQLLLKKGIITEQELLGQLQEAKKRPQTQLGQAVLEKMIEEFSILDPPDMMQAPQEHPAQSKTVGGQSTPQSGAPSGT